ncbi:acyltransferase [Yoonia sp. R78084]|uniref:acyltransferase n=1 Tax=Yoonia sp. R78084 TaxID=3093869 RepID=UPI0037DDC06A
MFRALFWVLRIAAAMMRRAGAVLATRLHRASLAKTGAGTWFQTGVRFDSPAQVELGADCYFWRGVGVSGRGAHACLRVGDRVQVNQFAHLDIEGGLTIHDDVMVSEHALIFTHDHGLDPHSLARPAPKVIGAGVWIGARAVILPSCAQIGTHAVIGAGAIVTRDVPAGAIVAGNPARIIGHRSTKEVAA